jgi:hypothetical protein
VLLNPASPSNPLELPHPISSSHTLTPSHPSPTLPILPQPTGRARHTQGQTNKLRNSLFVLTSSKSSSRLVVVAPCPFGLIRQGCVHYTRPSPRLSHYVHLSPTTTTTTTTTTHHPTRRELGRSDRRVPVRLSASEYFDRLQLPRLSALYLLFSFPTSPIFPSVFICPSSTYLHSLPVSINGATLVSNQFWKTTPPPRLQVPLQQIFIYPTCLPPHQADASAIWL